MTSTNKHNVLIITDTFMGMAGSERNISQLMKGIDKDRFQLYLACIYSSQLAQDLRERGHPVFDLRQGSIYTMSGLQNIIFLKKLITENNIALIVSYHETSDFYGILLSTLCKIPVISSRRDLGFKTRSHHRLAYRLVGRYFDAVITVCDAVKEEVVRLGWFPRERITTIYNGVDLREYESAKPDSASLKRSIGISADSPVVGLVANLRKVKGIEHFITAASHICGKYPDVQFVIIGVDSRVPGETIQDMRDLSRRLAVDRNVHFLGRRSDIPELISIFDVAVIASLSEGFSNAILEYMASGKPVVATTVGGNAEAVVNGETGFLVPPGDTSALSAAVLRLLESRDLSLRFGVAAKKRVEDMFTLEAMLKNDERFFEKVITGNQTKEINGQED